MSKIGHPVRLQTGQDLRPGPTDGVASRESGQALPGVVDFDEMPVDRRAMSVSDEFADHEAFLQAVEAVSPAVVVAFKTVHRVAIARGIGQASEEVAEFAIGPVGWADIQLVEEAAAVLAVVHQIDRDVVPLADRLPHPGNGLRIGARSLHEAAVAPQELVGGVARHPLEGLVGEDDRVVRQGRVGHHHGGPGLFDRDGQHLVGRPIAVQSGRRAEVVGLAGSLRNEGCDHDAQCGVRGLKQRLAPLQALKLGLADGNLVLLQCDSSGSSWPVEETGW